MTILSNQERASIVFWRETCGQSGLIDKFNNTVQTYFSETFGLVIEFENDKIDERR